MSFLSDCFSTALNDTVQSSGKMSQRKTLAWILGWSGSLRGAVTNSPASNFRASFHSRVSPSRNRCSGVTRVTKPDLTILVVDALTGNDAVEQGKVFSQAVKIDGIILAKLDADVKGGNAISLSYIMGRPVTLVGTGQGYDDLEPFKPQTIVKNLVG